MNPTHLLDTGWIIRHLRGANAYTQSIYRLGASNLAISTVSLAELYEGVYRADDIEAAEQAVLTFFSDKTIIPIAEEICRLFGRHRTDLRRQNRLIGDLDLLIAVTCLHHRLILLTTNPRHFERIPDLTVVSDPGVFVPPRVD